VAALAVMRSTPGVSEEKVGPEGAITRTEAALAARTVIVSALESQRPLRAIEGLQVAPLILSGASVRARQLSSLMIAGVGSQALFQRTGGQLQRLPPRRHLRRLQVQIRDRLAA